MISCRTMLAGEINQNLGTPIQESNPLEVPESSYPRAVEVGQISYNMADYINRHNNAFEGRLKDRRKALIKMYSLDIPIEEIRELNMLLYLLRLASPHHGIIQYICYEQDLRHTYLVFEYCEDNLKTAVLKGMLRCANINYISIPDQQYFLQLASAISFLHRDDINIQHCNINPENILCREKDTGLSLVISNFEWSQRNNDRASYESRDILCLGYVFYFMLTREEVTGENLVRDPVSLDVGAKLRRRFNQQDQHIASMATDLVSKMIDSNQIKAYEIKGQPFLWRNEKRKDFLRKIGNLVQDKDDPNIILFKKQLEDGASKIFDEDWMSILDPDVQSDLKGFKGMKKELCGLLRVIRNKIEHFEKIKNPELRNVYLGSSDGVVKYYMMRFPQLLPCTYSIYQKIMPIKEFKANVDNIDLL